LLQELENVQERQQLLQRQQQRAAESSNGSSSSRGVPPAVLLCGDFNTTPDSETVQVSKSSNATVLSRAWCTTHWQNSAGKWHVCSPAA
jgi:endonuclease/exonuclease/phosphatase family metal-dependent hydrolase